MRADELKFKNTVRSAYKVLEKKRKANSLHNQTNISDVIDAFVSTKTASAMSSCERETAINWIKEALLN